MRVISPQLEAHFAGGMTTLATCWKIIRLDGVELGFTDHDLALTIDGLEYDSIAGFTPTTVESKSNMSVDNLEVEGQTFPSKITESDLLAGMYDYAEIVMDSRFSIKRPKKMTGRLIYLLCSG